MPQQPGPRSKHARCAPAALAVVLAAFVLFGCDDDSSPVAPQPDFQATVEGDAVQIVWPSQGLRPVRVVRRLGAPPAGALDPEAETIYTGIASRAEHPLADLVPAVAGVATEYHYALYECSGAACSEIDGTTLSPTLVECLRAGGYTIYWRHADADVCLDNLALGTAATTMVPDWWRSCDADCNTATARQLNALGEANATLIGQQFDLRGIPVGRVLSSEFCRCFRTAELMDFGPAIELDQGITYYVYDESNRCGHAYDRIDTVPAAGTNTAIVGHLGIGCATLLDNLAWSECAIFKPQAGESAQYVTRVRADQWAALP